MTKEELREKANDLPLAPGVYLMMDKTGRVIYVGKAKNLRNRLTNYFQPLYQLHPRTQTMVDARQKGDGSDEQCVVGQRRQELRAHDGIEAAVHKSL